MKFQNVTVVDANSPWNGKRVDILIEDGKIQSIAEAHTHTQTHTHISPGWVDMRCQLSDPGYEWREDLQTLAAAALAGGFTRLLVQPNSNPVIDNAGQVQALLFRASTLPIHLHVAGALSVGAAGKDLAELYDMHQSGACAFTDGKKGTQSAGLLLRGLQYVLPFNGLVIDSPMDALLAEDGIVAEGISAVRMGLKGIPAVAEEVAAERDLRLLEHFQGRLHIGPVTTAAALHRLSEGKRAGANFTVETSVLYLLLDATENEQFDATTKIYPPLQEKASVLALRQALADGWIDVVSSGHHPQAREDKTHDFVDASFGADTLETAFAALNTAMQSLHCSVERLVAALSHAPRKLLGLPLATIVEGAEAEFTLFDPNVHWVPQLADIRSKCKYNPLIGRELQGKVLGTYAKGQFHSHP